MLLIEIHQFNIETLLVILIFFPQFLHVRLQFLHPLHGSVALLSQRPENKLDNNRQQDNGEAVVVQESVKELKNMQKRAGQKSEKPVVHRITQAVPGGGKKIEIFRPHVGFKGKLAHITGREGLVPGKKRSHNHVGQITDLSLADGVVNRDQSGQKIFFFKPGPVDRCGVFFLFLTQVLDLVLIFFFFGQGGGPYKFVHAPFHVIRPGLYVRKNKVAGEGSTALVSNPESHIDLIVIGIDFKSFDQIKTFSRFSGKDQGTLFTFGEAQVAAILPGPGQPLKGAKTIGSPKAEGADAALKSINQDNRTRSILKGLAIILQLRPKDATAVLRKSQPDTRRINHKNTLVDRGFQRKSDVTGNSGVDRRDRGGRRFTG